MSVLRWIVLALAAGLVVIAGVYLWQMRLAYHRVAGRGGGFAAAPPTAGDRFPSPVFP